MRLARPTKAWIAIALVIFIIIIAFAGIADRKVLSLASTATGLCPNSLEYGNQIVLSNDKQPGFNSIFGFMKTLWLRLKKVTGIEVPSGILRNHRKPNLEVFVLTMAFFAIFYQLSRTSSEKTEASSYRF